MLIEEILTTFIYYTFCTTALAASFMVITVANPMHSVLFLILVFANISGLFIMLGIEFLAMLFLIVYVGAIAILFLFVVMMLQTNAEQTKKNDLSQYLFIGTLFLTILGAEIFLNLFGKTFVITQKFTINQVLWNKTIESKTNLTTIGHILYDEFFIAFLLAGLILFIAMIGVILLTIQKTQNQKNQKIYLQTSRKCQEAIILWKNINK